MKIYTKNGDQGLTGLYDGTKVLKNNCIIDTLGNVDELNCELGCILACTNENALSEIYFLKKIQYLLFEMGSIIATPSKKESYEIDFDKDSININKMEELIDNMTEKLPKLTNFILPGGNILISHIHRARAICRRAERSIVEISQDNDYIKNNCIKFINRLSDYLFTLARYVGFIYDIPDVKYKKT